MCPPHLCERCYIWRQYQSLMSTSPCRTQCEFSASLWIDAWLSMITRQPQQRLCNYHVHAIRHICHNWRRTKHRRSNEALFSRESTTATRCCSTHHPAPFRSFSEPRKIRCVSFWKRIDVFVHICPGARCSTTTWFLTLTLSSKMSNWNDIIRYLHSVCMCM